MAWQQGQPWRVVASLDRLRDQIRAYAPRSVPPATDPNAWGAIGDTAHESTSDHFPHYYTALGATAVVCARDFPHAPGLGLDGGAVTETLRRSRDLRLGYIIFNRRITGPNHGWAWDSYSGSDPHDTHFHISTVHTAAADDPRPWTLPAGDTMDWNDTLTDRVAEDLVTGEHITAPQNIPAGDRLTWAHHHAYAARKTAEANHAMLTQLLARPAAVVDVAALAAALAPLLDVEEQAVLDALASPQGQAALVQAANTAEDS